MVMQVNINAVRDWSHADADILPLTYRAMDWVTTEIMNPQEPLKNADGTVRLGRHTGKPLLTDAQLGCLESMARRVFGALCYAGLLVAVVAEEIVRLALSLAAIPFTLPLLALQDRKFQDSWTWYCIAQAIFSVIYLIDGPLLSISAIVQKCLLDVVNEGGFRKELNELNICDF
ncbi:MAG: hypothetical protein HYX48_02505 [Chlamydiales bacterium]|nr:hypothetical protein [Chlamydiales bacterium]